MTGARWPALPEWDRTAWSEPWPWLLVLGVVCLLAVAPFLREGYVFFLDQTAGPAWRPFLSRLYGLRDPAYGGALPLFAVVGAVRAVLGSMAAQKVLLCGVVVAVAAGGYLALPGPPWARTYGAVLLLVNPFVYARLLAGQSLVVWGVAALPVALWAVVGYLERGSYRHLCVAVAAVTLLGFDAHALYAATVPFAAVTATTWWRERDRRVVGRTAAVALLALPVNAYWLGPALLSGDPLPTASAASLAAFAPRVDVVSAAFTTATLRGFWRAGYVGATDLVPQVRVLFVGVLFLAVYGAVTHYDDERHGHVVWALVGTAGVALLLGAGVRGPAGPVVRWAFDTVPLFAGMRDTNKFVALLLLAYAYLGALGVARLGERVGAVDGRRTAAVALLALCLPLGYAFPVVSGYAGQVHATPYPAGWHQAERALDTEPGTDGALFLPWHRYADYSWIGDGRWRVATPARHFFSRPVVQAGERDAVSRHVAETFDVDGGGGVAGGDEVATRLAAVDVRYVLLAKEVDWRRYDAALRNESNLTLVLSNRRVRVYRNEVAVGRAIAVASHTPVDYRRGNRLVVRRRSPVQYRVAGTERRYTVFAPPQPLADGAWRYDGRPPVAATESGALVFASSASGSDLTYAPFYRVYAPSYGVTVAAACALLAYGVARSRGGRASGERTRRRDDATAAVEGRDE